MKKLCILALTITACVCTATAGIVANAHSASTGALKVKDVTEGLAIDKFSVTDYEGNPLAVGSGGPESGDVSYTLAALNDGNESSWSSIAPKDGAGNNTLGWFIVDLGKIYPVNGISVTMMHDWGGHDYIVQFSETADFENALTVYNNDLDGSMNLGEAFTADERVELKDVVPNWGNYGTSFDKGGNVWYFSPVAARYVRVTNNQFGDGSVKGYSACGEINVYSYEYSDIPSKANEVAPVMADLMPGYYAGEQTLAVKSVYAGAKIYYTTNGSVPTEDSTEYTGPITLKAGKNYDFRFINVSNGVRSLPVDYSYRLNSAGMNVALGKRAKLVSFDGRTELYAIDAGENKADDVMMLTDGSFGVDGCFRLGTYDGTAYTPSLGWAVVDLGVVYSVDKIVMSTWQSWGFKQVVIQIAKSEDFSDAVTVYSNDDQKQVVQKGAYSMDADVSTNWILGNDGAVGNTNDKNGNIWELPNALDCRYIRVTDNTSDPAATYLTELQVYAAPSVTDAAPSESKNVAFGRVASLTSLDGATKLYAIDAGLETADDVTMLTDGSFSVDGCFRLGTYDEASGTYAPALGWAVIDLGGTYSVDKIVMSMWQGWSFVRVVIQIAKTADFSDAVTIYSNDDNHLIVSDGPCSVDESVSTHWSLGNHGAVGNTNDKNGNIWNFPEAKECRYVRVTDNTSEPAATFLTELQVFGKPVKETEEKYEYTEYIRAAEAEESLVLKTGFEKAEIEAKLNEKVLVTLSDGTERAARGTWTIENYDKNVTATYTAIFVPAEAGDAYGLLNGITVELKVAKYFISLEAADKTYDGSPVAVAVTGDEGYTLSYYKGAVLLDAAPVNAGEYKAVAEIGEGSDYVKIEKNFEITKAASAAFTVKAENKVYDGTAAAITVNTAQAYVLKYYRGTALLDAVPVNAGDYKAVAEIAETENYLGANAECEFTISKAAATVELEVADKVYDGQPLKTEVTASVDYTVSYYKDETALENAPVNAGYYKVVAETAETENYLKASAFKFVIVSKAQITLTVTVADKVYDGTPATVTVSGAEGYTVTWRQNGTALGSAPVNAGVYTVTAVVAESENYKSAINEGVVVISKASFDPKVKYNGKALTVGGAAPVAEDFTFEGEGSLFVEVPELIEGTITVSYTFTPANANYSVSEGTIEIEVKKAGGCSGTTEICGIVLLPFALLSAFVLIKKLKRKN